MDHLNNSLNASKPSRNNKRLTLHSSAWLYLAATCSVGFSVLFLDRPISTWMHHNINASVLFKPLSQMPVLFEVLSALVILSCLIAKFRVKLAHFALALIFTLISATIIRLAAKWIFGRTWPETWLQLDSGGNPSWITHGVEGFHPFMAGAAYNSFPSGHALFTFALVSVFWWRLPKLYPLWLVAMLGAVTGQLGQNYHFLGDLLAGATLGVFCAQISIWLSERVMTKHH
ncbi:phosphatase PAP2 family protein [Shewanella fidelis]|uniref:Phosphatase PAP2 family protein n=1 Tax=Shewanella fidelis TaxID=173509 RepID=A0AAW8NKU2_9GAMM|nr:phosphatase PAP2 family protein [Shewanella fidelis]MDR8522836.1 phosphatase PAP2 family protein [Shewanella fidelis]MDW4811838.1 phosphatase PAP2 family protein [Shewanella fidelis]MDW4818118.1 phosphatase PAP2 family protein [Shewanella fidelis]MDW4822185.1 phosphatase PAP2 family protein [Shewanella fidelis]MDW4826402.1 phosphatase PAP2 family protein [Shewanella fidelis]